MSLDMNFYKKLFIWVSVLLLAQYLGILSWFYFTQEQLIFHPDKLPASYKFRFSIPFEEITIPAEDRAQLHGLLFKANSSKGLVFYLHGNRGALDRWGNRAGLFVNNKFDTFILDYRGYGKSTGVISSEKQFYSDITGAYEEVSAGYPDKPKIIIGYSIGTGPAAYLAQKFQPDLLILMAPYFNLPDLSSQLYPYLPNTLVKYEFATNRHLPGFHSKIVIFHGAMDHLIDLNASQRLSTFFTEEDTLIILKNQGHGQMHRNDVYRREVGRLLGSF